MLVTVRQSCIASRVGERSNDAGLAPLPGPVRRTGVRNELPGGRKLMKRLRDSLRNSEIHVEFELVVDCPVSWESMERTDTKDDSVRQCLACAKPVHDFTGATKAEVVRKIIASGGTTCGQVGMRSDGRVVVGQCARDDSATLVRGRLVVR